MRQTGTVCNANTKQRHAERLAVTFSLKLITIDELAGMFDAPFAGTELITDGAVSPTTAVPK
ncbi:MAG: hypothetical protein V4532_07555, partial [Pseudomonadota bacterium]